MKGMVGVSFLTLGTRSGVQSRAAPSFCAWSRSFMG